MSNIQQTLSIIKPDAVERNLSEEIKKAFKINNFNILKEKKVKISKSEAEKFYQVHQSKLMGATDPIKAEEGTIRKKYGISIDKNSVHGSDSLDNAKIEIDFFFKD